MAFYAGFDAAIYPGAAAMAWLRKHSNLSWCGYYLSPAPSLYPPAQSWHGRRAELAPGWGLLPIYVGQQVLRNIAGEVTGKLTAAQGGVDGQQAVDDARRDGFPKGTCLYLDWESGAPLGEAARAYVSAWIATVHSRGFMPGIYCSHLLGVAFEQLARAVNPRWTTRIWCFKVSSTAEHQLQTPLTALARTDPAGSGYPKAIAWQYEMNAWFEIPIISAGPPGGSGSSAVTRIVADFSTALLADPGHPA